MRSAAVGAGRETNERMVADGNPKLESASTVCNSRCIVWRSEKRSFCCTGSGRPLRNAPE
jgi:hypothetical protein